MEGRMTQLAVVRALEALGFNLNEGRAYASLLVLGPSTGYEVSQHAGVPRSAVYAVLRKLVSEGAARREPGPPEKFSATPPEALLGQLERRFELSATELRTAIDSLEVEPSVPDAFGVQGYDRILEEASRLAREAVSTLVVSGWPRELRHLAPDLQHAARRGAFIVTFSHALVPESVPGLHFSYGLKEPDLEAFWKHKLVLVADDRKSILGATDRAAEDRAVVSETSAIAEIAVSQICLDITLLAQRHRHDVGAVMAKILGDRVGRLDSLLAPHPKPELGVDVTPPASQPPKAPKPKRKGDKRPR
jgi:sugar-specific transcriptional regulator TrmB